MLGSGKKFQQTFSQITHSLKLTFRRYKMEMGNLQVRNPEPGLQEESAFSGDPQRQLDGKEDVKGEAWNAEQQRKHPS